MAGVDIKSLMGLVGDDGVKTLSKLTNTSGSKVTAVLNDALPVLVGKMSDNASTKEGAASLNEALNEHKTGGAVDVVSFLEAADLVKFAKFRPASEEVELGYRHAERFISTYRLPEEPPQDAEGVNR